jgi:hypothetical protein
MWGLFSSSSSSGTKDGKKGKEPKKHPSKHKDSKAKKRKEAQEEDDNDNEEDHTEEDNYIDENISNTRARANSHQPNPLQGHSHAPTNPRTNLLRRGSASTDSHTNSQDTGTDGDGYGDMVIEVDENERQKQGVWDSKNLFASDPKPFVCSTMQTDTFPDPPIAEGWRYVGTW